MCLNEYIASYCLARDVSPKWEQQLRATATRFETWLRRPSEWGDLNDERVNQWLAHLSAGPLARTTVAGQRTNLLILWRDAWGEGLVPAPPRRIRKIAVPRLIPRAWTIDEVRRLLDAAALVPGRFRRTKVWRAKFWRAFVMVGWDTGLRLGDLLRIRMADVDQHGTLVLVQEKTGWPVISSLYPLTLAAVRATFPPERELLFGGAICREKIFVQFQALARAAGLQGGTKMLRRSGATAVESLCPGGAMQHLGHRTHGLAERHYLDPRLLQRDKPRPPKLA